VEKTPASSTPTSAWWWSWDSTPPRPTTHYVGYRIVRAVARAHALAAFTLITLGVILRKLRQSSQVVHPLIRLQIWRAGLCLLPMITFLACGLGLVIIGQTVSLLSRVGAQEYAGTLMVTIVVRELGPLVAALVVLARVGTATVVELGTARALGEVEALEALGIDPIHYLVVPRVIGLSIAIFCLTIYLVMGALASGYLFAFLQEVPLTPGAYLDQLVGALRWQDFVLLAGKTISFGITAAIVTCFEGLARPLRLEEVARATTRAVVDCVIFWIVLDACFLVIHLVL
jgi:phospholipid/cholesterol/gamma-HCH transport system permease protein